MRCSLFADVLCRIDVRTCTRTIHTLASHTSSGTGPRSPQVPGIAMAVPERILFVFLFSFISELAGALCVRFLVSPHPCPLRSSLFADVLCLIDVSTRTRTHHARSCRTSGRARGLITRTHPTFHRALEHDRPRIRFSCVSRWQCPIAFCFVFSSRFY